MRFDQCRGCRLVRARLVLVLVNPPRQLLFFTAAVLVLQSAVLLLQLVVVVIVGRVSHHPVLLGPWSQSRVGSAMALSHHNICTTVCTEL